MFCNFYLSVPTDEASELDKVLPVLCDMGIVCNTYRTQSVVHDEATGTYSVEPGMRVTCFDISDATMIAVWLELRIETGIHCVWLDTSDYNGCICDWAIYHDYAQANGQAPMQCSEYANGTSCEYANGIAFDPNDRKPYATFEHSTS